MKLQRAWFRVNWVGKVIEEEYEQYAMETGNDTELSARAWSLSNHKQVLSLHFRNPKCCVLTIRATVPISLKHYSLFSGTLCLQLSKETLFREAERHFPVDHLEVH